MVIREVEFTGLTALWTALLDCFYVTLKIEPLMSDEDFGVLAIPIVGVVAVFGVWLIYAVYNALPWSTVSPQAQSAGANAANTAVSVLSIDPTTFLIALA